MNKSMLLPIGLGLFVLQLSVNWQKTKEYKFEFQSKCSNKRETNKSIIVRRPCEGGHSPFVALIIKGMIVTNVISPCGQTLLSYLIMLIINMYCVSLCVYMTIKYA